MASPFQQIKLFNFFGGIADDIRRPHHPRKPEVEFAVAKHFDIFSQPNRLIPYRSLALDTNDGSTSTGMKQYMVKNFVYHSQSTKLYGLGQTGVGLTKIVYKADATTGNWTLPTSAEGTGIVQNDCFVEYKDFLWGFQGTTDVFKYGTLSSGSPTISSGVGTTAVTITSVAQGVIAKDDNLYMPYNNRISRVTSGGTYNDSVIILPTNFKITSVCNYGNYLSIACAPISTFNGKSRVFLWNLTSTDVQEAIDWGDGELRILESVEGMLIGVTDRYLNNSTGAGSGSMIIQGYSGGTPQVLKEVFTQALTGQIVPLSKAVKSNRLFWSAKIMTNSAGTTYDEGIWSFGRKSASYPYALSLDIIDENVTPSGIQAFGTAANYFFITHSGDGSIDKTSSTATYSFTSILETKIYDGGDASLTKKLQQVSIMTTPITAGSVTLKYKVDKDSSWRTIGTYSTVNGLAHDFYLNEYDGTDFATWGEVKFRVESTGGVEVTALDVRYSTLIGSQDP